ncbi:hypothetical protein [Fodinicola acaciae]|uniref:hypothetical protein n=1 Tax=Fodinicola acaciae TaxID=2681555 RepID=UPI0013D8C155|nr:hypothetical protein [Fodinicola acaciae]
MAYQFERADGALVSDTAASSVKEILCAAVPLMSCDGAAVVTDGNFVVREPSKTVLSARDEPLKNLEWNMSRQRGIKRGSTGLIVSENLSDHRTARIVQFEAQTVPFGYIARQSETMTVH